MTANGSGIAARPKSPLKTGELAEPTPAPARAMASASLRKTAIQSKPKANILGAKKTKLGAKKVDTSALDFDEAEKKAREEEERKQRLGYDPDEEIPSEQKLQAAPPNSDASTIHQPTPLSPGRAGGFGTTSKTVERSGGEMERLGMGVRKLGFGQVGGGAPRTATASKTMGFGSTSKAAVDGTYFDPRWGRL